MTTTWRGTDQARLSFRSSVLADAAAHVSADEQPTGWRARALLLLRVALTSAGFRAVLLYRLAYAARIVLGPLGGFIAGVLGWFGRHWYGCTLASTARLHGGLILPHPMGIVIGGDVVIGPRAWLFQHVTIGGAPGRVGMPHIGADARIYSGAVVAGPIRIGDGVVIGANSVVSRDVPSRSTVRAIAAISIDGLD